MVTDNRCLKFSITHTPRSGALPSWPSIKGKFLLCLVAPTWRANLCLWLPLLGWHGPRPAEGPSHVLGIRRQAKGCK